MKTNIKWLAIKIDKKFHEEVKSHARRHDYESTKAFIMAAIIKLMSEQKAVRNKE